MVFAIAMSTGLLIGSIGAVKSGVDSIVNPMMQGFEGKEILVSPIQRKEFFDLMNINLKGVENLQLLQKKLI